ncbi:MAG: arginase family protein [Lachnospiraceae bacterium]|nr:arginase family protein [Lachnospiraceae bacterium]
MDFKPIKDKCIFWNPHWQGGAEVSAYYGSEELVRRYLNGQDVIAIPTTADPMPTEPEHDILGYQVIIDQLAEATRIVAENPSRRSFTVTGSCDADVPTIAAMNARYEGDLALIWMDAHADINSPSESPTKLFYGMPVRALLGDCGEPFNSMLPRKMEDAQIVNFGGRDLDWGEVAYFAQHGIPQIDSLSEDAVEDAVLAIKATGRKHLYIHLDLDLLNPPDFPTTPIPVPDGMPAAKLMPLLRRLKEEFDVVAFSLNECMPFGYDHPLLREIMQFGLEI